MTWRICALAAAALAAACGTTASPDDGSAMPSGTSADAGVHLSGASDAAAPALDSATSADAASPKTDASDPGDAAARVPVDAGPRPPDPCLDAGTCPPGTWINVTPPAIDLVDMLDCSNYGIKTVQVDPLRPSDLYALFFCQGVWKSTDYGATWTGPINTGTSGANVGDCAGGITIPPSAPAGSGAPTLYMSCIRGTPLGFWRSTNGGVDWTNYPVLPAGGEATATNQQFYPPVVDPYDPSHLLMAGHAMDLLVESTDGGMTWKAVATDPKMANPGGTGGPEFIDTGSAGTTRTTWLWLASQSGGVVGTWRTTSGGAAWTHVDANEHTNGANGRSLVYQPDTGGVMYMAGLYSAAGFGVLRSADYGVTWTHEGASTNEAVIVGTAKNLYAMYGWAIGAGQTVAPVLQVAALGAPTTWTTPDTPAAMTQGPAEVVATSDGTHGIVLAASYNAGLWRYVEP